jgi:hypothetical protein
MTLITEDETFIGIEYYPEPANKFRASTGWGKRARFVGYFDTLEAACAARDAANKKGQHE